MVVCAANCIYISVSKFLRRDVKFGCLVYSKNDSVSLQLATISVVLYNSHHEKGLWLDWERFRTRNHLKWSETTVKWTGGFLLHQFFFHPLWSCHPAFHWIIVWCFPKGCRFKPFHTHLCLISQLELRCMNIHKWVLHKCLNHKWLICAEFSELISRFLETCGVCQFLKN